MYRAEVAHTGAIILTKMEAVIHVEGLVKRFGDLTAVDGITFDVYQAEIFGILGPNGAGKTTTLEIIEGLQRPTEGRTRVLGIDTQKDPVQVKERIGIQLQASAYFEYLTLRETLGLFGSFYKRRLPADELLDMVGLQEKGDSTLKTVSGGQRQKFTLAASLVNDPEVLILDEPTTGLDPQARREIWDLIRQMNSAGKAIVLTTHYMEEAAALCHRVAIMDRGRILAVDSPDEMVRSLGASYQVRVLALEPLPLDEMEDIDWTPGEVPQGNGNYYQFWMKDPAGSVQKLLQYASQNGIRLDHLEVLPATLEDVFLDLTGRKLES